MIYVSLIAVFGYHLGKCKPSLIFIDSVSARLVVCLYVRVSACRYVR
jgi:hypothetical protein